jgi:competence transcription factor ComK
MLYSSCHKGPACSAKVSQKRPLLHHVDPMQNTVSFPTRLSKTHFLWYSYVVSKSFHTRHVVALVVLGCLLVRFNP